MNTINPNTNGYSTSTLPRYTRLGPAHTMKFARNRQRNKCLITLDANKKLQKRHEALQPKKIPLNNQPTTKKKKKIKTTLRNLFRKKT